MLFKGTTEIEVSGVKIGLKFGTLASGYFCEQEKITLAEMAKRLQEPTPFTFINTYYSAAKAYSISKGHDFKYTTADAADWIDTLGFEKAASIMFSMMSVYEDKEEKNVLTPAEVTPG
jgi:hypothetical protein